ncbi:MAG: Asp-tRNA(Asn)/Glu-tRNA(Gln) amidotransferase subunit GatC [Desulfobacteraceae bacterium]|nr:Asp-tRNA(Asn)/Glu-tRNA(Gln) amidotransferase subunit GatC [Desulfobacteraceae bacterium]
MKLTRKDVLHVAALARLNLHESAIDTFAEQLGAVLEYAAALNSLDTAHVPPTFHAVDIANVFREDAPGIHLDRNDAFANAPEAEDGHFIVPKVIE